MIIRDDVFALAEHDEVPEVTYERLLRRRAQQQQQQRRRRRQWQEASGMPDESAVGGKGCCSFSCCRVSLLIANVVSF